MPRIDDLALTLFFVNDHLGRGPQYEWALQLLRIPEWRTAFS
jgi:hypothetical protein